MFDIDSGKLLILAVIALIVIKPKDLPGVMRQIGATIGQLRRMAGEFQGQFRDALREAELDEIKKDMAKVTDIGGLDPFASVKTEIEQTRAEIDSQLSKPITEQSFAELIEPAAPVETHFHAPAAPPPEPAPSQIPHDVSSPARGGATS